jgi:NADPH:quinone reductase-like Zn-dependent oxidoreductase
MNAASVYSFDAPPRYGSFAEPAAGEGEVIVSVSAAGLHPLVRGLARGTHYGSSGSLPFVPGVDGVGRLQDGTRVFFMLPRSPFGSFAERTVVRGSLCLPLAEGLDDATAAGTANPGMSSWVALKVRARLAAGESVLILGATGSAGQLAIQIAKRMGAGRVIAAGRDPQEPRLKELGADAVVSLNQERADLVAAYRREWAVSGVDVVLDYLWGQPAEILLEAIAQKGLQHAASRMRYVQIGSIAGETISVPGATLRSSKLELLGSGFGSASLPEILQSISEFLQESARQPFQARIETAPLHDVEAIWGQTDQSARVVFRP